MKNQIRFVHTNLIAKDWKKLAAFYIKVFGCKPIYPERDLEGQWIEDLTGIGDVHIRGIHLTLPGYETGPTLEIFEYNKTGDRGSIPAINEYGFGHIAFHVENVEETINEVLNNGGSTYGELIEKDIEGIGRLKVVYTRDPEGNIVEVQNWGRE